MKRLILPVLLLLSVNAAASGGVESSLLWEQR